MTTTVVVRSDGNSDRRTGFISATVRLRSDGFQPVFELEKFVIQLGCDGMDGKSEIRWDLVSQIKKEEKKKKINSAYRVSFPQRSPLKGGFIN